MSIRQNLVCGIKFNQQDVNSFIQTNRLWARLTPTRLNTKMAENSEGKRDFTKFNGVNFPQWKFAVMLKLKQKKLDGIVLGYDRKPNEVIT